MADRSARLRDAIAQEHGLLPDSAPGIRAEREALRDEALDARRRIAAELKQLRDSADEQYGPLADTTAIIRQVRDTE